MKNVAIEKAANDKIELAKEYGVPESAVIWCGDNKYIVIKNGVEIKI